MEDKQQRLEELSHKWRTKTLTEAERLEFDVWFAENDELPREIRSQYAATEEAYKNLMLEKIRYKLQMPERRKKMTLWPRLVVAASVTLLVVSAGLFYFNGQNEILKQVQDDVLVNDFAPGSNKAILTLAGGKQIVLNDAKNGELANQGNTVIRKTADGEVVYEAAGAEAEVVTNTMTTPRGGQYHLTLVDGTGVWLNAASSITYPSAFKGNDRQVEISGEVYFEVAHNVNKPFRVKNGVETVEVLGTHFNINAYPNEGQSRTTLLEGSIALSSNGKRTLIKPGQQAVLSNGKFVVNEVELGGVVAWKNGYFQFVDADIETMMRQIARWYDVEVEFEGPITKETFTGRISRFRNISQVLKLVKSSRSVQLTYQGRRIMVR